MRRSQPSVEGETTGSKLKPPVQLRQPRIPPMSAPGVTQSANHALVCTATADDVKPPEAHLAWTLETELPTTNANTATRAAIATYDIHEQANQTSTTVKSRVVEKRRSNLTHMLATVFAFWLPGCYIAGVFLNTMPAFNGWFMITWHLTNKLFPAKRPWAGNICKSRQPFLTSEGTVHCCPQAQMIRLWQKVAR